MGKIRLKRIREILSWFVGRSEKRHRRQKRQRLLPMAASSSKTPSVSTSDRTWRCYGCLRTYNVISSGYDFETILYYARRGWAGVFIREGEVPKFCPHCRRRPGLEILEFDPEAWEDR